MRAGYLWLLSFLVFPIVGAPLLTARTFRAFGLPARAVLSAGVGAVLLSWTMTLFALLRLRWGPSFLLVAAALAFALRLLLRGHEENFPSPRSRGEGQHEGGADRATTLIALSLATISILAALLATLAGRSTSPDLLLFWGPKAQQFAAARTIDADFLSAPYMEYLHVYYPPLVTNVFAFAAMIAGRFPWGAATQTFPLLLAATAIGLAGILKMESRPARAAATAALATCAIALLGIDASVAGNAEPFLLFFEIVAVALLLTPAAATTGGKLVAGLFLAGAATSKVEGLPFVLATVVLFVLVDREHSRPVARTVVLLLGPTILALGAWLAFGELHKLFRGYRGYGEVLAVRWGNFSNVAEAIGIALAKVGYALPWLVPISVWLLTGPGGRRVLFPIGIAAALAGFLLFTYLTTAGDPTLLIAWSAARVFSPISALFALAAFASRAPRPDTPSPSPG